MKSDPETEWLKEVNSQSLQQSAKDLETAYGNFFKGRTKFPKFKKRCLNDSFRCPQKVSVSGGRLIIPKFKGGIVIKQHRQIKGIIKSCTVSKTSSGKYYVSILCEEDIPKWGRTEKCVGVDVGIKDFVITSDGDKYENPKLVKKYQDKLRKAQKDLSRKQRGSNRYNKQKLKVARIHEKITNSRKDMHHKLSTNLVSRYDLISIEDLSVKNMVKNSKLSKAISDCGWSGFFNMLDYKCGWYGKKLVKIDKFYPSSKTCSNCDYIVDKLPLNVRKWQCPSCNVEHDRDVNAAYNIYRQGLSITGMEGEALATYGSATTPCEVLKEKDQFDPEAHESLAHG